jgi:uncharacterized OB-fold protein/acyl dehydratase
MSATPRAPTPTVDAEALMARVRAFEGRPSGAPMEARDEVNQAMIRHWTDAVGDDNPVYADDAVARANGFPGVIAPPTMLQAWIMRGYRSQPGGSWKALRDESGQVSAQEELFDVLDAAGFTSVVATNCDQEYVRPVVLGDRLTVSSVIESVSPEKHTALGDGHFVTTRMDYVDQDGAPVATMRFRILRFRPRRVEAVPAGAPATDGAPVLRPRPAITHDNAFFFEGTKLGRLLIQRCASCGALRHPPRPACPTCRSFEWDTVTSTGRGTVFSYVVVHHPQVPGFEYPLPIAVVELAEGTRLVADLIGVDLADVHVGMPVVVDMVAVDDELTLPMFRPDPDDAVARRGA